MAFVIEGIPVGNFFSLGPPNALVRLNVSDKFAQRPDAMGATRDMRVQANIHDPRGLFAVNI